MLDREDCSKGQQARRQAYETAGLGEFPVTSDDLGGIHHANTEQLVDELVARTLEGAASVFSRHHYTL